MVTTSRDHPDASEELVEEVEMSCAVCSMCIFCGEHNKEFTDEGLDVHYWKHCPVLKRCQHCRQVSTLHSLVVIFSLLLSATEVLLSQDRACGTVYQLL